MTTRTFAVISTVLAGCLFSRIPVKGQAGLGHARNVIIIVIDGLRHGSVNERDMPALSALRSRGVDFRNSYALFPTLTMPNASAMASGHQLGDTGIFGNTPWLGRQPFDTGNFNLAPGSPVPFLENDQLLGDIGDHGAGELFGEDALLSLAAAHGYNTIAVGKIGPIAVQHPSVVRPLGGDYPPPSSAIVIDDATGTAGGVQMPAAIVSRFRREGLSMEAPSRSNGYGATSPYNNGYTGDNARAGTIAANTVQQQWMADVTTRVLLPHLEDDGKPFALVFWSRDPDGTQHNQGDSLGTLFPGINGVTSRLGIQNADRNLAQIVAWLDQHPSIASNTDIVVTSDHGFATISHREIDRAGHPTMSESAKHSYLDVSGRVDKEKGMLPYGFLAIDLALDLKLNVFDPDRRVPDGGRSPYKKLRLTSDAWERPIAGNGLLGDVVQKLDGSDATLIVAANGGSDLIYVPSGRADTVQATVRALLTHDYVGGIFVDDTFGAIPGTLPLSAIGLRGSGLLPRPAIVVAFTVFYFNPADLQTAVQVADTALQEGQGVHGGFGRDSTYNTLVAFGPDFKTRFVDSAPVSNADIMPTVAHLLGFDLTSKGALRGRIAAEALAGGPDAMMPETKSLMSSGDRGAQTALFFQQFDGERYGLAACMAPLDRAHPVNVQPCR